MYDWVIDLKKKLSYSYLQERFSFIDKSKTAIWGWSYGGYTAAMALTKDTKNVFKCGLSVAPVTDWIYYGIILFNIILLCILFDLDVLFLCYVLHITLNYLNWIWIRVPKLNLSIRVFRLDLHRTLHGIAARQHKWIQKRQSFDSSWETSWKKIYGYTRHVWRQRSLPTIHDAFLWTGTESYTFKTTSKYLQSCLNV